MQLTTPAAHWRRYNTARIEVQSIRSSAVAAPAFRGMRIRIIDVLDLSGNGLTADQVLQELPDLEPDDMHVWQFSNTIGQLSNWR